MMTASQCPTAERLQAYVLGQLAESDNDELFKHLSVCPACQAELETVDGVEDSLISELRVSDDFELLVEEPDCKLAVAKALGALASDEASAGKDFDRFQIDSSADSGSSAGSGNESLGLPRTIGEYEIVRRIGSGGMGSVMLARHTKLGRQVAVKFLSGHRLGDPRMRNRFDAEMKAIGQLSHPNIVTAHDAREVNGTAVLVTEYIDGMDLGEIVGKLGPLAVADACEVIRKVAAALQYTSDQGVVHRDVKPSNIMISRGGEVKLLDLGLARYQSERDRGLTATGQAIGTADYVSPEQVTDGREVDAKSDLYSLGCTLFKLLTGHAPFADQSHQTVFAKMTAHVSETPPRLSDRLPDCPPELARLVDSMLSKDPSARPESPAAVAATLGRFAAGHDLSELVRSASAAEAQTRPLPASSVATPRPWYAHRIPVSVAIATGIAGVVIGLFAGMWIKIKYPDGTTVKLPANGAEIEFVQEDGDDPRGSVGADKRSQTETKLAEVEPMTPTQSSAAAFEHGEVGGVQTQRTTTRQVRSGMSPDSRMARRMAMLMNTNPVAGPLQGIWRVVGNSDRSLDSETNLIAFDDSKYFSVQLKDDDTSASVQGSILRGQFSNNVAQLQLEDERSGETFGVHFFKNTDGSYLITAIFEAGDDAEESPAPIEESPLVKGWVGTRLERLMDFPDEGSDFSLNTLRDQWGNQEIAADGLIVKAVDRVLRLQRPETAPSATSSKRSKKVSENSTDQDRVDRTSLRLQTTLMNSDALRVSLQGIWMLKGRPPQEAHLLAFDGDNYYRVFVKGSGEPTVEVGQVRHWQVANQSVQLGLRNAVSGEVFHLMLTKLNSRFLINGSISARMPSELWNGASIIEHLGDFPRSESKVRSEDLETLFPLARILQHESDDISQEHLKRFADAVSLLSQIRSSGAESLGIQTIDFAKSEAKSKNDLKQIGLAFHNFNDQHGHLPGSVNRSGEPVGSSRDTEHPYSWRVALLPFLGQESLFKQYRFDEPWDSESNKKLLDSMPEIFRSPHASSDHPTGQTHYLGFSRTHAALGKENGRALSEIIDGAAETVLVAEAKQSVPWTQPQDIEGGFELQEPATLLMVDGSVRSISLPAWEELRKMITHAGNEVVHR